MKNSILLKLLVVTLEVLSIASLWFLIKMPSIEPDVLKSFQIMAQIISAFSLMVLLPVFFRSGLFMAAVTMTVLYFSQSFVFEEIKNGFNKTTLEQSEALMVERISNVENTSARSIFSGFDVSLKKESMAKLEAFRNKKKQEVFNQMLKSEAITEYKTLNRKIEKHFARLSRSYLLSAFQGRPKNVIRRQNPFLREYLDTTVIPSMPLLGIAQLKGEDIPLLMTDAQLKELLHRHVFTEGWDAVRTTNAQTSATIFFLLPLGFLLSSIGLFGNLMGMARIIKEHGFGVKKESPRFDKDSLFVVG